MDFLELLREPGVYSRDTMGMAFQNSCQDSCLVMRDTSGFSSRLRRTIGTPLDVRGQGSLSSCQMDIGIPINFQVSPASSTFEALNSWCLSSCQRYVRRPVEMRQGTRAFFSVSTLDSDIPSF